MKTIFRAEDWWQGKAALLMGMVYLFTAWFNIAFAQFVQLALLSIITISGFASLGYLLNDLFDLKKDALAGKKNFLAGKSTGVIILLFLVSASLLLLPWKFLPFDLFSVGLIAVEILLFLAYSVPPVRLKERGAVGIIVDALYAHSLPVLLAAYTFLMASGSQKSILLLSLLVLWQTISGVRNILLHQYEDRESDKASGTKNFASSFSETQFPGRIRVLIITELVSAICFFVALALQITPFIFCAAVILSYSLALLFAFRKKRIEDLLNSTLKYFPNNIFEKWIPAVLLLILSYADLRFLAVLLIHLLLFNHKFFVEVYNQGLVPSRDNAKEVLIKGLISLRYLLSYLLNYFLYFVFLIFGVNLKKEKTSAMDYLRKHRKTKQGQ